MCGPMSSDPYARERISAQIRRARPAPAVRPQVNTQPGVRAVRQIVANIPEGMRREIERERAVRERLYEARLREAV